MTAIRAHWTITNESAMDYSTAVRQEGGRLQNSSFPVSLEAIKIYALVEGVELFTDSPTGPRQFFVLVGMVV